ncbi:hypothetical protein CEXT_649841 [Caerostris extrusa]|uniref:Uncharacterized protein n=1 Tax=Caerostris extrusa TaxID=172846 RepID=A0AAV4MH94_CAEEX|nr:hypothetical protein CEXT_649841 [Caerostris extrusa]
MCMDSGLARTFITRELMQRLGLEGNYISVEIHCCCDANEMAFGAAVFSKDDNVKIAFVASISRLAPIKRMAFPR